METSTGVVSQWLFVTIKFFWERWRALRGYPVRNKLSGDRNASFQAQPRPPGKLFWFHVSSYGTASIALPFVQKCLLFDVHVLVTSSDQDVICSLRSDGLHPRVLAYHFAFNSGYRMAEFAERWKPQIAFFMEDCDLGLHDVQCLQSCDCRLVLFKARLPSDRFLDYYSCTSSRQLFQQIISHFSIIIPESQNDVGRFRMLGASLDQIPGWCCDLNCAAEIGETAWALRNQNTAAIKAIKRGIGRRSVWMAMHVHEREVCLIAGVHNKLRESLPELLMFLAPQSSKHCETAIKRVHSCGLKAQMWTSNTSLLSETDIFIVDPSHSADILAICSAVDAVFVGSSLISGMKGSSIARACVANCAVVIGKHNEDFVQMTEDVNHNAVIAAEEAEAVVYNSAVAHHSDDYEEEEQETTSRPFNGMLHHLVSRTPSSPFSFVDDILMSSFPYYANTSRPQTAPPALSLAVRESSLREHGTRSSGRHAPSPVWRDQTGSADFDGRHAYRALNQEDGENEDFRNLSRASCPGESFNRMDSGHRGDLSVFQIEEEHYATDNSGIYRETTDDLADIYESGDEEEGDCLLPVHRSEESELQGSMFLDPQPSPMSEAASNEDKYATSDDESCSESKTCSPINTARRCGHGNSEMRHDLRVLSPSGEYVMPATHLPFGTTGPAIWTVNNDEELAEAMQTLLTDHLQRRSRGHAASQGAARFAIGLVLEVWKVVFDHLVEEVIRIN